MLARMSRGRRALVATGSLLLLAACGRVDVGVTVERSEGAAGPAPVSTDAPSTNSSPDQAPDSSAVPVVTDNGTPDVVPIPPVSGAIDFGDGKPAKEYDAYLDAAFADITRFWTDVYEPTYGGAFEPVAGIYAMYPERGDNPQSCEGPIAYADVEGNAFYTSCGDLIAYDDAELLPDLVQRYGTAAVAVVAAHEFGHAIQQRAGVFDLDLPTIDTEQQADCFAGAWAAHAARGEGEVIRFDDADVKAGLLAMIEVRDPPGFDSANDPNGHGSAFDRVGAFQEGFINGVERCAGFIDDPNPRIDLQFLTEQEFQTGGNLPFDQILAALPVALDTFWVPALQNSNVAFTPPTVQAFDPAGPVPDCDGRTAAQLANNATFCAGNNTIVFDQVFATKLYDGIGDLAFSYPIANAYSDAVQTVIGSPLTGEPRVLLSDCLVGAWIVDIVPAFDANGNPQVDAKGNLLARNPNQQILLSAGDLDEAVVTAVVLGDEASTTDMMGTAFEKIDAFREGVLGGLPACQARLG
jgi:predicted metalloprotease